MSQVYNMKYMSLDFAILLIEDFAPPPPPRISVFWIIIISFCSEKLYLVTKPFEGRKEDKNNRSTKNALPIGDN